MSREPELRQALRRRGALLLLLLPGLCALLPLAYIAPAGVVRGIVLLVWLGLLLLVAVLAWDGLRRMQRQ